jgi:hypothetical protein
MAGSRNDHPHAPHLDGMMFSPSCRIRLRPFFEAKHRTIEDANDEFLTIGLN